MQRKIPNINFRDKLHSIPISKMKNVKSNVLYSIPSVKHCAHFCRMYKPDNTYNRITGWAMASFAFLLISMTTLLNSDSCYAVIAGGAAGTATDSGTISAITGGTSTPATASLSLSNPSMVSSATTPGDTATVSTNVTVNVSNAESYSLTLKVDSATMQSGNTTISAGNVVSDNTWGYKWDNTSSFVAPSTSGTSLAVPALSDSAASFTKTLTFGAKFASSADPGTYHASGTLSLVATPQQATVITLADLTQMQQLTLAPEACANTPYLSGQNYSAEYKLTDVRDGNTYTVRKFGDGKCWMTQNLKLSNIVGSATFTDGRKLIPSTSDIDEEWTLPPSSTSGFSSIDDITTANMYYNPADATTGAKDTGYYSWCAATAGSCSSATSGGDNASSSICPKGWKLPTGMVTGTNTTNDFYNLFKNMGLTISGSLSASSSTSWGSGDLDIVQKSPYNFAYTGQMYNGSTSSLSGQYGNWWSRTAVLSTNSYRLIINSNTVYLGTSSPTERYRSTGLAVRCIAE